MTDDEFEWDDAKAAENLAKHGVDFVTASSIFRDPFAIEICDDRYDYGEDRYIIIGMVEQRCLCVAYALRADTTRIISARRAKPHEQRRYYEENT